MNDPLYNHTVFGPDKGKGGIIGKTDDKLITDLISIHNAENWLGMDGDSELSMFNKDQDQLTNAEQSVLSTGIIKDGKFKKKLSFLILYNSFHYVRTFSFNHVSFILFNFSSVR